MLSTVILFVLYDLMQANKAIIFIYFDLNRAFDSLDGKENTNGRGENMRYRKKIT